MKPHGASGRVRGSGSSLAILLLLAAGCAGSPPTSPTGNLAATVSAGTGTAALLGLVTDDEMVPLAGAIVQVIPLAGANTTVQALETGSDGRFSLTGMEAGPYSVLASRLGYEAANPVRVELRDGETTNVSIRLTALAIATPFHETVPYTTYFHWYACVVTSAISYCPLLVFDGTNSTRPYEAKPAKGTLQTFIVESRWTSSVPLCVQAMRTAAYSPQQAGLTQFPGPQAGPYYWDNRPNVTSPTRLFIPREGSEDAMLSPGRTEANGDKPIETAGKWHVQIFPTVAPANQPAALQCTINQRVNVWISAFYEQPAADDWTALA